MIAMCSGFRIPASFSIATTVPVTMCLCVCVGGGGGGDNQKVVLHS